MTKTETILALSLIALVPLSAQDKEAAATAKAQKLVLEAAAQPPGTMKYVQTELKAKVGVPIELTFKNPDILQHNVLVLKPGSKDKVGALADAMIVDPEGMKKSYTPASADVLHSIPLLANGQSQTITFTLDAPGDYPLICTFPGHWRIMNAVLKVEP